MASRGWGKNKKGVLVNSAGKTALEVRVDKYASKLKARKEMLAAKKAAKASRGGGGGALQIISNKDKNRNRLEERRQQPEFAIGSAKGAAAKALRQEIKRIDQERQKEYEPIDAKLKARQQKEGISDGEVVRSKAFKQWDKAAGKIEEKYYPLKEKARNRYQRQKEALQELEDVLKDKTSVTQIKRAIKKVQEEIPEFKLDAKKAAQKAAQNATSNNFKVNLNSEKWHGVLGVSPRAQQATVKRAYKKAMERYHPDKGGSKEAAQKINNAYDEFKENN